MRNAKDGTMIRTGFPRAIGAIFLLVLVVLGGTRSAAAQGAGRSVAWQRFDVDLAIQLDGSVQVSETQAIQFTGTYQQGYRLVPLDRTTGVTDVSVSETIDGRSIPYGRGTGQANTYSSECELNGAYIRLSPLGDRTKRADDPSGWVAIPC
jgi:hypothetical protein